VSDAGDRLAAIVIEPVVERLPSADWIQQARDLAKKQERGSDLRRDEDRASVSRPADTKRSRTWFPISPRSAKRWRTGSRSPPWSATAT
jgi:hypothetical protein